MNKISLTKAYIKNPFFLSAGFNLLSSLTISAVSSAALSTLHPDPGTYVLTTLGPFLFNSIFGSMIASETEGEGKVGVFFNPLKKLSKILVNNYIHGQSQKFHVLDDTNNASSEEGARRAIKHFFFICFQKKHSYGGNYTLVHSDTIETINKLDRIYFYHEAYFNALKREKAPNIIQEVFSYFKNDALFTYSLDNTSYDYSSSSYNSRIDIMLKMNKLSSIITEKDTKALKKIFKNKSIDDATSFTLVQKENYKYLPKHFREELLLHMSSQFLEKNRSYILDMEKKLDDNLIKDMEKQQQKNQLNQIQDNIETHDEKVNTQNFDKTIKQLPHEIQDTLQKCLKSAEYLSLNMEHLSATQAIEFKNLINHILPKYLDLFITQDIKKDNQIEKITKNLNVLNECFEAYQKEVQNQKNSSLEVYENFFEKKIESLNSSNHVKLKSSM